MISFILTINVLWLVLMTKGIAYSGSVCDVLRLECISITCVQYMRKRYQLVSGFTKSYQEAKE